MHRQYWLAVLWVLLFPVSGSADWYQQSQDIMGTRISVEVWSEDKALADRSMDSVMAEMHRIDRQLSPYKADSELSLVNDRAADEAVVVSDEMLMLLERSLYYSRISDGAFDISFASVGRFYDYREGRQPDQETLESHLPAIDYRAIELNTEAKSVRFLHPLLKIDLGGIAKGYAVDRGIEILQRQGIVSAIVTAGGDSKILGDRGGRPWVLGIRHPRQEQSYAVKIPLFDTALSTSGDYERFFMEEGHRIHHIVNPATGRSASGIQSVSILAPEGIDSDALSTTLFVLGIKKGLALVNSLEGIDAIIIDSEGKLHYSAELLMSVQE